MSIGSPISPNANTVTNLRSIPASTVAECSHILVTNPSTNATSASVRIAIAAVAGPTTPGAAEWITHGLVVAPGETASVPVADYIPNGQHIVVFSDTAGVAFRACGREVAA